MPRTLGTSAPAAAPPATRVTRPGWRDPRLWIGVALVAACVVAGARLLGAADDSVRAWAVGEDQAAGVTLSEEDLVATRVRFEDAQDLARYFRVDEELPASLELLHPLGAGELLPRSAVGRAGESGLVQVPITVDPGQVPPSVEAGSLVDVYLSSSDRGRPGKDGLVLEDVSVVADVPPQESFSVNGLEQLTVAVPQGEVSGFFATIRRQDAPKITIVRKS